MVRDNKLKNLNSSQQSQDTLDQTNKIWAQKLDAPAVAAATTQGPEDLTSSREEAKGETGQGKKEKRKEKKKKKKNKECTEIEERPKDNKENKTKQNKKIQKTTNESNNEMQPD